MKLTEIQQEAVHELIRQEIKRINQQDNGRPKSLGELEDLVSELKEKFANTVMKEIIDSESAQWSPEKKTVPVVEKSGNLKDIPKGL